MDWLRETRLLDYGEKTVQALVAQRGWRDLPERERIGRVYDFVRDEIAFGYNAADETPASGVLADGYGQCNTKGILFMGLLRACGIRCRLHGFTIDKALQKGAITGLWYTMSPRSILHSWVEVEYGGRWVNLEGFILDTPYLRAIQGRFPGTKRFCGYAIATHDLQNPPVAWSGGDTFIQREGINRDFGVYPDPDAFFTERRQALGPL